MRSTFGEDLAIEINAAVKTNGKPNLLEDPNLYSKSVDDIDMLKGSSSAGKDAITETAESGLTDKAQASAKRLEGELTKDEIKLAKEQLVTLNVARTEMMSRLDDLANDVSLSPGTRNLAETARNAIKDHATQNDLAGALRDVHGKPVVKSGDGYIYNHQEEVTDQALTPLENLRDKLIKENKNKAIIEAKSNNPDFSEYQRISKEVDAISEMITKIKKFLEIGK